MTNCPDCKVPLVHTGCDCHGHSRYECLNEKCGVIRVRLNRRRQVVRVVRDSIK